MVNPYECVTYEEEILSVAQMARGQKLRIVRRSPRRIVMSWYREQVTLSFVYLVPVAWWYGVVVTRLRRQHHL